LISSAPADPATTEQKQELDAQAAFWPCLIEAASWKRSPDSLYFNFS